MWTGECLEGRRILVWAEQGVGDEVMFAGLLSDLLAANARCNLACSPRLVPLMARSFPGVNVQRNGTPTCRASALRL